jgi:hypothetical protein
MKKEKGKLEMSVSFDVPKEHADVIEHYVDIHVKNRTGCVACKKERKKDKKIVRWNELTKIDIENIDFALSELILIYGLKNLETEKPEDEIEELPNN